MKTEQLALILYKLISKTSASVEVPASINEKHFVRIIISDIANNEILDDLGGWDCKLFGWRNVESAHVDGDTGGDVAIIDDMYNRFVFEFVRVFVFESPTIVEEQLVVDRNLKSCLYCSRKMF